MPRTIDLNADLGEGCPWDYALLGRVTSASVCCGAHAGDPETIHQTLRWAGERGVVVGAHPGYPDRENFGRRDQNMSGRELALMVELQLVALEKLAARAGVALRFVKPHGALYNQAQREFEVATYMLYPVFQRGLPILGQPGSFVERMAGELEVPFIAEGFADRRYQADGRLVPRSEPNAMLHDPFEIRQQVLSLVDRGLRTICIHGDDPRAVDLADLVLDTLKDAGIEPRSFA
jgi:5-oxoprolinase (ATP-hydrolysing) subunit A